MSTLRTSSEPSPPPQEIKTQSPRVCGNRENIESSRTRAHRSRLVLRPCRFGGPTCVFETECWCRCCQENIWRCKEERNETRTLLSVIIKRCKESSAVVGRNQVGDERCERWQKYRSHW